MPEESIVFSGDISDRSLDKSARKVEDKFSEAGQIDVDADTDGLGLDGFGDGGDMNGGGGDGTGALEVAGISSLASKIPKPIAGVAAGSVLPIALAGGVGASMLSAMHSASARLQTSTSLLGIAVDNFFREPGNVLDEHVARPIAKSFLDASLEFDEALRSGDWFEASGVIGGLSLEASLEWAQYVPGLKWTRWIDDIDWVGVLSGVGSGLDRWLETGLPTLGIGDVVGAIGWPTIAANPVLQNIAWPAITAGTLLGVIDWPSISVSELISELRDGGETSDTTTNDTEFTYVDDDPTFPESEYDPSVFDDTTSDSGFTAGDATQESDLQFESGLFPSVQTGGRIERSGVARVHRGELVSDPDRLVRELSSAISRASSGGGSGGSVDMGRVESKLDQVNRNLKTLARAMSSMAIEVDGETLGRATANAQVNSLADSNNLV